MADLNRQWTIFAIDAEYEAFGMARIVNAHNNVMAEMHELTRAIEALKENLEKATGMLKDIGDFAHDRSTGPAVADYLWEVRRMAYEALE